MLFIPLPFVVALLIALLIPRTLVDRDGAPEPIWFAALLGLYALLSVLVGLRWGYGLRELLPVQSVIAACWAPLAWLAFRGLDRADGVFRTARDWPHLLVPGGVLLLVALWPAPIDLLLIAAYAGYGAALLRLWRRGPDALVEVRLGELAAVHRALGVTALALLAFALVDVLISIDFHTGDGARAARIVTLATVPMLLVAGYAASVAGIGRPPGRARDGAGTGAGSGSGVADVRPGGVGTGTEAPVATGSGIDGAAAEDEDEAARRTLAIVHETLVRDGLYTDPDLSLERIARRSLVPARRVSAAINRVMGESVSRYLSGLRLDEAKRRLATTDVSVTEAMLAAGFRTKSNFNRVFRDAEGTSPTQWRRDRRR